MTGDEMMNEQAMIWFLQKSARHQLSRPAITLWMDFYAYLQNQNRACYPQIAFTELGEICDLEPEQLWAACKELSEAMMLKLQVREGTLFCRLVAGRLYRTPDVTAG